MNSPRKCRAVQIASRALMLFEQKRSLWLHLRLLKVKRRLSQPSRFHANCLDV
jgi:hypothetical protein